MCCRSDTDARCSASSTSVRASGRHTSVVGRIIACTFDVPVAARAGPHTSADVSNVERHATTVRSRSTPHPHGLWLYGSVSYWRPRAAAVAPPPPGLWLRRSPFCIAATGRGSASLHPRGLWLSQSLFCTGGHGPRGRRTRRGPRRGLGRGERRWQCRRHRGVRWLRLGAARRSRTPARSERVGEPAGSSGPSWATGSAVHRHHQPFAGTDLPKGGRKVRPQPRRRISITASVHTSRQRPWNRAGPSTTTLAHELRLLRAGRELRRVTRRSSSRAGPRVRGAPPHRHRTRAMTPRCGARWPTARAREPGHPRGVRGPRVHLRELTVVLEEIGRACCARLGSARAVLAASALLLPAVMPPRRSTSPASRPARRSPRSPSPSPTASRTRAASRPPPPRTATAPSCNGTKVSVLDGARPAS